MLFSSAEASVRLEIPQELLKHTPLRLKEDE